MILGSVGPEPASRPVALDCAVEVSERPGGFGQTRVVTGFGGLHFDRVAEQQGGPSRIASPKRNQAEQMKSIQVVGIIRERHLSELGSPRQVAPPKRLPGQAEIDWHHFTSSRKLENSSRSGNRADRIQSLPIHALR